MSQENTMSIFNFNQYKEQLCSNLPDKYIEAYKENGDFNEFVSEIIHQYLFEPNENAVFFVKELDSATKTNLLRRKKYIFEENIKKIFEEQKKEFIESRSLSVDSPFFLFDGPLKTGMMSQDEVYGKVSFPFDTWVDSIKKINKTSFSKDVSGEWVGLLDYPFIELIKEFRRNLYDKIVKFDITEFILRNASLPKNQIIFSPDTNTRYGIFSSAKRKDSPVRQKYDYPTCADANTWYPGVKESETTAPVPNVTENRLVNYLFTQAIRGRDQTGSAFIVNGTILEIAKALWPGRKIGVKDCDTVMESISRIRGITLYRKKGTLTDSYPLFDRLLTNWPGDALESADELSMQTIGAFHAELGKHYIEDIIKKHYTVFFSEDYERLTSPAAQLLYQRFLKQRVYDIYFLKEIKRGFTLTDFIMMIVFSSTLKTQRVKEITVALSEMVEKGILLSSFEHKKIGRVDQFIIEWKPLSEAEKNDVQLIKDIQPVEESYMIEMK